MGPVKKERMMIQNTDYITELPSHFTISGNMKNSLLTNYFIL